MLQLRQKVLAKAPSTRDGDLNRSTQHWEPAGNK